MLYLITTLQIVKLLTTGFNNTGTWSNSTAYKTGDAVNHGGHYYVGKIDGTGQERYN